VSERREDLRFISSFCCMPRDSINVEAVVGSPYSPQIVSGETQLVLILRKRGFGKATRGAYGMYRDIVLCLGGWLFVL
jgi:hypothetical protein